MKADYMPVLRVVKALAKSKLCFTISRLAAVNLPHELRRLSALPLTLPRLNLPSQTLPHLTLPHLTLPHLTLPHLTLPHLTLPHLTLPHLTLPHLTLPDLTLLHLTLPHLMPLVPQILTGQANAHFASRAFALGLALPAISDPPIRRSGASLSISHQKEDAQMGSIEYPSRSLGHPNPKEEGESRVFLSTAKLYLHRQESHSREKDIRRDPRPLISKRRKRETYPCEVCGKVFLHHLSLKAHVKNHSQEPPSQVQQVGKSAKEPKLAEKTPKKSKINLARKVGRTLVKAGRGRPKKIPEEEGEFPCPSCAEVFSLQSALKEHEELHQPTGSMRHCSVCSQGMGISKKPGAKLRRAYHCVPCLKAFVTLDTFLQHCQDHLVVSGDEEGSDYDPDSKI
ncbi:unnamed protein product [Coregonus sp. 'balchen']|nr:unnamed protein product [Coregonus sp. 'balchen']